MTLYIADFAELYVEKCTECLDIIIMHQSHAYCLKFAFSEYFRMILFPDRFSASFVH